MTITKILIVSVAVIFGGFLLTTISKTTLAGSVEKPVILSLTDGASVYAKSCAICHGVDGQAQTKRGKQTRAADLTSEDWEPDEARDIRIVAEGKRRMPGFKRTLKPAQIKSVVAYIRSFK